VIEIAICGECKKVINTEDDTFVIHKKVYYHCYSCWKDTDDANL
jgi:hypothetical protein